MTSDDTKNGEKPGRVEKVRRKSRFRRISMGKGRSSKQKHSKDETQSLLNPEDESTETEFEQEEPKRKPGAPTIDEIEFKDVPVYILCPNCQNKVVTKTEFERAKEAKCASICLCLLQCYCCFWIPLVMEGLKNIIHTCPNCKERIGIYKRVNLF